MVGAGAHLLVDRLSARARDRMVLDGLSFALARGQTLALLGPAGAGKTATLLLLAGFLRPALGVVRLAGRDITVARPERRDIAMAFAQDALFPHLTVLDNVGFGLKMRGVPGAERRRRAARALEAFGVAALAARLPTRLDPAQRRRVALARAVAVEPALLLLDEPATPETPAARETARGLLAAALQPAHATAILATHDCAAAFALADQVALLRDGRVEQIGTPRALFDEPANGFVAGFTGGCNLVPATLLRVTDGVGVVALRDGEALARCPPSLPPGPATLCLRPHLLRLDPAGPWRGTVSEVAYHGALTRVTLRAGGQAVTLDLAAAPGVAPGQAQGIAWAPGDAWLAPAE